MAAPPYSAGNWIPSSPRSASFGISSIGKCWASSHSRMCGLISVSANSRTLRRSRRCSSLKQKSTTPRMYHELRRYLTTATAVCARGTPLPRRDARRAGASVVHDHAEAPGVVGEVIVVEPEEQASRRAHTDRSLLVADEEVVDRRRTDAADQRSGRAVRQRPVGIVRRAALTARTIAAIAAPANRAGRLDVDRLALAHVDPGIVPRHVGRDVHLPLAQPGGTAGTIAGLGVELDAQ